MSTSGSPSRISARASKPSVAVNTTVDREALTIADAASLPEGGISGAPLKRRALEVLERLHQAVGDQLVLISVGGIETPEDVWERVLAGATLVQAYTGFVYGGPGWPRDGRYRVQRLPDRAPGLRRAHAAAGRCDHRHGLGCH